MTKCVYCSQRNSVNCKFLGQGFMGFCWDLFESCIGYLGGIGITVKEGVNVISN